VPQERQLTDEQHQSFLTIRARMARLDPASNHFGCLDREHDAFLADSSAFNQEN
jgi:hypothetical protein